MNVTTWNIAQLPWLYNGTPDPPGRISRLCNEIVAHSFEIDLACFQELFSSTARETLRRRLSHLYPHMYLDDSVGKFLVGVNSGLGIISKYPLAEHTLYTYTEYKNIEYFAKKGVMGVRTSVPAPLVSRLSSIYIFTTHMQTGGHPPILSWFNTTDAGIIKLHQLREAANHIHSLVNDPNALVVLCGDLNMDATEIPAGLQELRKVFPSARDVYDLASTPVTYSVEDQHKRIDYFIVLSCPPDMNVKSVLGKFGSLTTMSDHLPASMTVSPYVSLI